MYIFLCMYVCIHPLELFHEYVCILIDVRKYEPNIYIYIYGRSPSVVMANVPGCGPNINEFQLLSFCYIH